MSKSKTTRLVIVESPAKCNKIKKFLSKIKDYEWIVKASYGHVNQLKPSLRESIDINNNFKPSYMITEEKKHIVRDLSKIAKRVNVEVIIATDPDREGEAIGYHLLNLLNLDIKNTKRIFFNQITEKAVLKSLENPVKINMNLVKAQQARCILDKLMGYEISPVLWRHIKSGLSAGRCQSPALRLLCTREEKIKEFSRKSFFKVSGSFVFNKNKDLEVDGSIEKSFNNIDKLKEIFKNFLVDKFSVKQIKEVESTKNPSPPLTTSSLQQDCSSKLGISPKDCMMIAQKLYEGGLITYMRTDSIDLSKEAINDIKEIVKKKYGEKYLYEGKIRFKNKSKNSQEAHEAIRPVKMEKEILENKYNSREKRVYNLIWKRTIASQIISKKIKIKKILIEGDRSKQIFKSEIEDVLERGFEIVYKSENKNMTELFNFVSSLKIGERLQYKEIEAEEKYTKPLVRYNEATLIKDLEKLGIGRPSTYSSIITRIQDKNYVEKKSKDGIELESRGIKLKNNLIKEENKNIKWGNEKDRLFVSEIGDMVNKFLEINFTTDDNSGVMDFNMTADLEEKLDNIAEGNVDWIKVIRESYDSFHPIVDNLGKSERAQNIGKRILGKDDDGLEIGITMGKDGYVVFKKGKDFKEKWKFGSIDENINVEEIDLLLAKKLLEYPKNLGKYKGRDIIIKKGKFGPYISYDGKNYSVDNVENITMDYAKKRIENKILGSNEKIVGEYMEKNIYFLKGKYGNYIKYDDKNYSLNDKNMEFEDVDVDEMIKIIKNKNSSILKEFNKKLSIRQGKKGKYVMFKEGKGKPIFVGLPDTIDINKISEKKCMDYLKNEKK